jgi:hypothetical protein
MQHNGLGVHTDSPQRFSRFVRIVEPSRSPSPRNTWTRCPCVGASSLGHAVWTGSPSATACPGGHGASPATRRLSMPCCGPAGTSVSRRSPHAAHPCSLALGRNAPPSWLRCALATTSLSWRSLHTARPCLETVRRDNSGTQRLPPQHDETTVERISDDGTPCSRRADTILGNALRDLESAPRPRSPEEGARDVLRLRMHECQTIRRAASSRRTALAGIGHGRQRPDRRRPQGSPTADGPTRRAQGLRTRRPHSLHDSRVTAAQHDVHFTGLRRLARNCVLHTTAANPSRQRRHRRRTREQGAQGI